MRSLRRLAHPRRARWGAAGLAAATASLAVGAAVLSPASPAAADTGLPAHILTGYYQDFVNSAKPLKLADVPTSYNLVAVAFANATITPGAVSFAVDPDLSSALGGYTDAQFKADIATLHSRGQKVILSVGGQNGTISVSDQTSANNFASSVSSIISSYGFDGVDIDLENGVNPTYMASALEQVHSNGASIITLAPQTIDMQSTQGDYFQLALNIKDILTIVNMQYYNSGSMLGCDGQVYGQSTENFLTALACIQGQGGLRPDQIGLGLPASTSAAGGGYQDPGTVINALKCLSTKSSCGSFVPPSTLSGIRGAMDWSINWDASNNYAFANTISAGLGSIDTASSGGGTGGGTTGGGTTPPAGCAAAWVSTTAYTGGQQVSYNGHDWTAKWWTQGDVPGANAQNVWTDAGAC